MKHAALESQGHFPVRDLTEMVCERLQEKDYLSEYIALNNFNMAATRYVRDPRTVELVKAPYVIVEQIMAGRIPALDCDDKSALLAAQLLAIGAETRFATVAFRRMFYRGIPQYSHVFVQAREPRSGAWVSLDPVAGDRTREMLGRVVQVAYWPIA